MHLPSQGLHSCLKPTLQHTPPGLAGLHSPKSSPASLLCWLVFFCFSLNIGCPQPLALFSSLPIFFQSNLIYSHFAISFIYYMWISIYRERLHTYGLKYMDYYTYGLICVLLCKHFANIKSCVPHNNHLRQVLFYPFFQMRMSRHRLVKKVAKMEFESRQTMP